MIKHGLILVLLLSSYVCQSWETGLDPNDVETWLNYPQEFSDLIYGPEGVHTPGYELEVRVAEKWTKGTLYYKLIRVEPEIEIVSEKTIILNKTTSDEAYTWRVTIPEKEGTYLVGCLYQTLPQRTGWLLNGTEIHEKYVTGYVKTIPVRKDWLQVEMNLDKEWYKSIDDIVLSVRNLAGYKISIGPEYRIEQKKGTEWVSVPFKPNVGFILLASEVLPNETYSQSLQVPRFIGDLEPGRYRVEKEFLAPN